MFIHCGGKDRLHLAINALRELDVPVYAVADFDVLDKEQPLRRIVEAAGGDWNGLEADWRLVKAAVDSKKPESSTSEVVAAIESILTGLNESTFPEGAKRQIQTILKRASPWSIAKSTGESYIPSGEPTQAYNRLAQQLQVLGLFVVRSGELESFDRSVGSHGPTWVNSVLGKDLKDDPALEGARRFVSEFAF
jgi:hypothetical protein